MTTPKTGKFDKKLLAAIAIIIIVVAAAASTAVYMVSQPKKPSSTTLPAMSLTLVGADGQQKVITQTNIAALQSYTGKGGYEESGGLIAGYGSYTGVPVTTLLNLVGGITSDQELNVSASDGYTMVFTYNQTVNGQGFSMYNPATGNPATPTQPIELVLSYYLNGTALASGDGPLRISILGSEGLLTAGRYWVSMVTELQVIPDTTDTS
jgi:hypothetical protein